MALAGQSAALTLGTQGGLLGKGLDETVSFAMAAGGGREPFPASW